MDWFSEHRFVQVNKDIAFFSKQFELVDSGEYFLVINKGHGEYPRVEFLFVFPSFPSSPSFPYSPPAQYGEWIGARRTFLPPSIAPVLYKGGRESKIYFAAFQEKYT
jgi:hypothetical protein